MQPPLRCFDILPAPRKRRQIEQAHQLFDLSADVRAQRLRWPFLIIHGSFLHFPRSGGRESVT
jgi:hypothetical protein